MICPFTKIIIGCIININGACIFYMDKIAWFRLVVYTLYVAPILINPKKGNLRH